MERGTKNSCNVYVVSSDKGNILIDPGHYDDEIRDYIYEIGGLDAILLTHGHWDHTFGLDRLKADFPDAPVYMPEDNTPGHCRGCALYYFKNENVLFTGDTIMKRVVSPIRLSGSEEDQRNSILKFSKLGYPGDTPVYPGHGESTTYGYLMKHNPEVKGVLK